MPMDVLGIAGLNSLAAEQYSRLNAERRYGKTADENSADNEGASQKKELKPEDIHNAIRLRGTLVDSAGAMNLDEARETINQLAPAIAAAPGWRLDEILPLADRTLLPSSYV